MLQRVECHAVILKRQYQIGLVEVDRYFNVRARNAVPDNIDGYFLKHQFDVESRLTSDLPLIEEPTKSLVPVLESGERRVKPQDMPARRHRRRGARQAFGAATASSASASVVQIGMIFWSDTVSKTCPTSGETP